MKALFFFRAKPRRVGDGEAEGGERIVDVKKRQWGCKREQSTFLFNIDKNIHPYIHRMIMG